MQVIIIGGVAGGMSAATRLRRLDEDAEIIVLERSGYVSFANCGLPYHVGGVIKQRSALLLQSPESLGARFRIDVRVGTEATAIDRNAQVVHTRDVTTGATGKLAYDKVILSPGARPARCSGTSWTPRSRPGRRCWTSGARRSSTRVRSRARR